MGGDETDDQRDQACRGELNQAVFGVGAGYDFNEKFGISANYDRLKGAGDGFEVDADTLTLGFEARF